MADFKVINTQEEFDAAIKDRLQRQETQIRAEYADYSGLKEKAGKYDSALSDLDKAKKESAEKLAGLQKELDTARAAIKTHEIKDLKAKIADETGLPAGLRDRLAGETEEEIREDAKSLQSVMEAQNRQNLPGFNGGEQQPTDKTDAALKDLLVKLTGKAD